MRSKLGLGFVLLAISITGWAQKEHEKALALYKQGKFADAIVQLDESIASHPDWYFPILLKGQCNLKLKHYDKAMRNFNDALTLEVPSKDIPKVKYFIAKTYMAKKDYNKAIHAYNELIPLIPKVRLFDTYLNRGQCEMQVAKMASAANDKEKANSFFSKAIVSFTEALASPTTKKSLEIEAAFQKAYAQYKIGNYDGGIQSLQKSILAFQDVIKRNPKERRAHKFIIDLGFRIVKKSKDANKPTKYREVVTYIDNYLKIWADDPDMVIKKGQALQGAKQYKDAIEVFHLVNRMRPNDGGVLFSLGSCQMAAKQYKAAIKSFRSALESGQRKNHEVYSYTAYCYQQQKTGCAQQDIPLYQSAVNILQEGMRNTPSQAKAFLGKDLQRKKDNLSILQENKATDNQNHLAVIENIKNLADTIEGNMSKLSRNQDMYIQQPTSELQKAIDEGKEAIKGDEVTLSKELSTLNKYIQDAKKCGGAKTFKHFTQMQALYKQYKK